MEAVPVAMEEEPAAEQRAAALTEELPSAEEVERDVAEYSLPAEVRVATNLILHRVNVQTGGVLTLVPHMESDQYYYDAIIRFCSMEDMCETGSFKDGWKMPQSHYKNLEVFCLFGTVSEQNIAAGIKVKNFMPVAKRTRDGNEKALGVSFNIEAGSYVAYKGEGPYVLRAMVLNLALYMPNEKKTPMATACGGQVVVFAYVFNAFDMEWDIVVIVSPFEPRSTTSNSPVLPLARRRRSTRRTTSQLRGFPRRLWSIWSGSTRCCSFTPTASMMSSKKRTASGGKPPFLPGRWTPSTRT